MRLQTLYTMNLTNALFACGFPLPAPNAFAKGSILDARSAEPVGNVRGSGLASVQEVAGDNGYTDKDAEFYVRSVEPARSL